MIHTVGLHERSNLWKMVRVFVLGSLISTLWAGTSLASPWQLGLAVGSAGLSGSSGPDLDLRGELRVGKYLTDRFALELQGLQASAVLDASLSAWMVNGVFDLRPGKTVVPYVLAGAGYSRFEDIKLFSTAPAVSGDGPAYQVGLGTHVYFGSARRVALRLELSSLWESSEIFDRDRHTSLVGGVTWTLGR